MVATQQATNTTATMIRPTATSTLLPPAGKVGFSVVVDGMDGSDWTGDCIADDETGSGSGVLSIVGMLLDSLLILGWDEVDGGLLGEVLGWLLG